MKRLLLEQLICWKNKKSRKPLLIDGARQTGKTFLLLNIFGKEFHDVLRVDFLETPALSDAFNDSLDPDVIISNIELFTGQAFNKQTDLLILDEIGECPKAIASLKFFAEKSPQSFT